MPNPKSVISTLTGAAAHWVGDGFPVRTIFSAHTQNPNATSPFLLLDHAGPKDFPPSTNPRGVDEHPHRGFETVTIVYQGELEHRDSSGNSGKIGPGDVQWMTAASGVVHEEKHARAFTERGGTLEMVQLWVNLPARAKMSKPRYQEILDATIPAVQLPDDAGILRVIAGEFQSTRGPAKTVTPVNVWDLRLKSGGDVSLTLPAEMNTIIVVLRGEASINSAPLSAHEGAVLGQDGDVVNIQAHEQSTILILSGEPIDEPVVAHGPFVMNTAVEIKQAMLDYQSGRMGHLEHQAQ